MGSLDTLGKLLKDKTEHYRTARSSSDDGEEFIRDYTKVNPYEIVSTAIEAARILSKFNYDALAFRGMSGALITPLISILTGKPFIMVHKPETSHSCQQVEGYRYARTYIIIDDFVCTGKTVRAIVEAIKKYLPEAECLGVLQTHRMAGNEGLYNPYETGVLKEKKRNETLLETTTK